MTTESSRQKLFISNFLLDFTLLLRNMVQHVKNNNNNNKEKHFDFPRKVLYHVFTDKLVDEDKFKKTTSAL